MTNRLPYETQGGNVNPEITFEQMIEYLRHVEEDCREMAAYCHTVGRGSLATKWVMIADRFMKMQEVVDRFAKDRVHSSTGFRSGPHSV